MIYSASQNKECDSTAQLRLDPHASRHDEDGDGQTSNSRHATIPRPRSQKYGATIQRITPPLCRCSGNQDIALKLLDAVENHLPGRVNNLAIDAALDDVFVVSGVVNSYYAKQMAQHVAMGVLSPGARLVNDIEVRTVR